jgi:hypothetical protein
LYKSNCFHGKIFAKNLFLKKKMSSKDFSFDSDPFEQLLIEDKELQDTFYEGLHQYKASEVMIKCSSYLIEASRCFQTKVKSNKKKL